MDDILIDAREGDMRVLTLNRPAQRNGLSVDLMDRLLAAVNSAADEAETRVVVIRAEGPVFCAGHDLKELTAARADPDRGRAFFSIVMSKCSDMMQSIVRCPKPVIAEVHAMATAAGCQLVASCDLAVASEAARFATPGVNIGLFCSTPMVALSRNVGRKRAMEMLLTGEPVGARRAAEIGLVNTVVPAEELREATTDLARKVAASSTATVAVGKRAFYEQVEMPLAEAYDHAQRVMVENMLMRDAEEGIGAFLQKRPPAWEDR